MFILVEPRLSDRRSQIETGDYADFEARAMNKGRVKSSPFLFRQPNITNHRGFMGLYGSYQVHDHLHIKS